MNTQNTSPSSTLQVIGLLTAPSVVKTVARNQTWRRYLECSKIGFGEHGGQRLWEALFFRGFPWRVTAGLQKMLHVMALLLLLSRKSVIKYSAAPTEPSPLIFVCEAGVQRWTEAGPESYSQEPVGPRLSLVSWCLSRDFFYYTAQRCWLRVGGQAWPWARVSGFPVP